MATKFTFPKTPKVGDRIEVVSTSATKLPINIVGNSESGKDLSIIFPGRTFSGTSDGETVIATITENNTVFTFKCVSAQDVHTWLLEGTCLYSKICALEERVAIVESELEAINETLSGLIE